MSLRRVPRPRIALLVGLRAPRVGLLSIALLSLLLLLPRPAAAAPAAQVGGWDVVAPEGATCGRGAAFEFFVNEAQDAEAGIVIYLNGGGACVKEGPAPRGASGPARALHCMDFPNFTDPLLGRFTIGLAGSVFPFADRSDGDNPFRDFHHVMVPYCTGDVHVGRMTEGYDYDPTPDGVFEVTHRGHLNVLAVLDELDRRFPTARERRVVLTGASAGGIGAIFNFPHVVQRWPNTALIPDAGIAPGHPGSLLVREGLAIAERWSAGVHLPDYCPSEACMTDTLRLLRAHAAHHAGEAERWLPFGYLQAQQDGTLSDYFEIDRCSYQVSLRAGVRAGQPQPNLRAFVPATDRHVLTTRGLDGSLFRADGGQSAAGFLAAVGSADAPAGLPGDVLEPWLACNDLRLPWLGG